MLVSLIKKNILCIKGNEVKVTIYETTQDQEDCLPM